MDSRHTAIGYSIVRVHPFRAPFRGHISDRVAFARFPIGVFATYTICKQRLKCFSYPETISLNSIWATEEIADNPCFQQVFTVEP